MAYSNTRDSYIYEIKKQLNDMYEETDYSYKITDESEFVKPESKYEKMLHGVMEYLESAGGVEFAVLKDPELGKWWSRKVKIREENRKKEAALEKLKATMSDEELKILGIRVK